MGIPLLFNAALIGILIAYINAKVDGLETKFDARFEVVNARFEGINRRFDAIDERFDCMRDLWRSELHRVEEVLDARL